MAGLLGLGTYWMIFAGGADTLERHPGVYMLPPWPASKLRVYWLAGVGWNVAIAALLFVGFPGAPGRPGDSSGQDLWFAVLFPFAFVGVWLLVSFVLSEMGGWRALARRYAAQAAFSGTRFRFRSARLGGSVGYGSCLTLGASPRGLYLSVLPMFRIAHPPLLIPWNEITASEARSWLFPAIEFEVSGAPHATLRVSRGLARALLDASGSGIIVHAAR